MMDIYEAMKRRHSIRKYLRKPIEEEKVLALREFISSLSEESGLRIELVTNDPDAFSGKLAHYGSFEGCVAAVVKGCGSSISDIEVYRRAVGYYFPGATVRFKMEIDLVGSAADTVEEKNEANVQECEKDAGCESVDKPEATASDGSLGGEGGNGETVKKKISLSLLDFM